MELISVKPYRRFQFVVLLLLSIYFAIVPAGATTQGTSLDRAHTNNLIYQVTADAHQPLNHFALVLDNVDLELTINDVHAAFLEGAFTPANGRSSPESRENATWVRIDLLGTAAYKEWYLVTHAVSQRDLQIFTFDPDNGRFQKITSGNQVPFHQGRELPYRHPNIRLNLNQEEPTTVYLRYYDPAGSVFPLTLEEPNHFSAKNLHEHIGFGIIFGIIAGLILYNLVLMISLREPLYGWYVLSTFAVLLVILEGTNFSAQYIFAETGVPRLFDRTSTSAFWGMAVALFAQRLLNTKNSTPRLHSLISALAASLVLVWGIHQLGFVHASALIFNPLAFFGIVILMITAGIRLHQGNRTALFFLVGHGAILLSGLIMLLRTIGVIDAHEINTFLFPGSVAFETIIFSLALAHRIQILRQQHRTAVNISLQDPLTNTFNRRGLDAAFKRFADENKGEIALILLDLNKFKQINDQHGHDVGDALLQEVARRTQSTISTRDCLARLGGDEFAILLHESEAKAVVPKLIKRLHISLNKPFVFNGIEIAISAGFGAATTPASTANFARLYRNADQALYAEKAKGGKS